MQAPARLPARQADSLRRLRRFASGTMCQNRTTMLQQKPILLVLGGPPDRWFRQLGPAGEEVEIRLAPRPEDLDSTLPEAEIVFTWEESDEWLRERWSQARKLKWVQSSSAGVELLLFPELVESSVVLTNGQGLYAEALGEFVLFCVLSFAKDYRTMEDNRRARRWRNYNVVEARGQTIGIVGLGGTGRVIARMAKVFGMRVIATKRIAATGVDDGFADAVVPLERWHELLAESDFVVNTLPLTPQTTDMFNEAAFRAMKPGACFINVGRGDTVDEDALLRALKEGWIAAAGLDVFKTEPLPPESEFYDFPNVIVSPHCADLTPSYPEKSARLLVENLGRYLKGDPLLKVVDKRRGY